MNACELNAAIMALTNHFYTTLSRQNFIRLSIFFSQLSKNMFAMELLADACRIEHKILTAEDALAARKIPPQSPPFPP